MPGVIQRQQNLIEATIDGETVMMDPETGHYYGLDSVATRIWQLLESPKTVSELVSCLLEEYEVSREQCEADVQDFIKDMQAKGTLVIDA